MLDTAQEPIGGILICENCLRSINAATGELATATETLALTPDEAKALRERRGILRRAKVRV